VPKIVVNSEEMCVIHGWGIKSGLVRVILLYLYDADGV
jgi:hypothetical protein